MARDCEVALAEIEAKLQMASPDELKALRQRRKLVRSILNWCKTRAGYFNPNG
jgi:hypothetical protein